MGLNLRLWVEDLGIKTLNPKPETTGVDGEPSLIVASWALGFRVEQKITP